MLCALPASSARRCTSAHPSKLQLVTNCALLSPPCKHGHSTPQWRTKHGPLNRHLGQNLHPNLTWCSITAPGAAAAAAAAAAAGASVVDMSIVSAASQASFKLLFLCAVVAWMSHRGMIPANTSQVMSQVAFSITIPAMLLVSTTKTLTNSQVSNLAAIPVIAITQIAIGAALGKLAAAAVEGRLPLTRWLCGWGDLHPTPSAAAIAASTAAALRVPAAAPALLPKPATAVPPGLTQLVQVACSFGNTVTLPLMYLMTMLAAPDAARATGYMSLFHAAWSPCLWMFGYSSIKKAGQQQQHRRRRRSGISSAVRAYWGRIAAALGLQPSSSSSPSNRSSSSSSSSGLTSPNTQPVLIAKQLPPSAAGAWPGQGGRAVYAVTSEAEQTDESPAEALVKRAWQVVRAVVGVDLLQQLAAAVNPPVAAVLAGLLLGLSPAGQLLSNSATAAAFISQHTTSAFTAWELSILFGMLRCCWETVELLASGTLALQALVLAASLFGTRPGSSTSSSTASSSFGGGGGSGGSQVGGGGGFESFAGENARQGGAEVMRGTVEVESPGGTKVEIEDGSGSGDESTAEDSTSGSAAMSDSSDGLGAPVITGINVTHRSAGTADDASASVLSQLRPRAAWEWRAMLAVAAVRFVLLPTINTGLVLAALQMGLLPPDPVCAFMLLLQSAMPPAQNLVLMVQLQPGTAWLAPATARLLLQLYTLAVVPVTLWVSVFGRLVL